MNMSQEMVVNKLPTRTWNHLQVNEATIPWNVADTADLGTDSYAITAENQAQPLHIDLTGAAGFCTGKGAAHAVLLHLDLPAVLVRQPDRRVGSQSHKNTPPWVHFDKPARRWYNTVA